MFSLGCIQALRCHQNTCPTGVTTHNKRLQRALVVEEKYLRVANYCNGMNREIDMIAHSCGVRHARELRARARAHRAGEPAVDRAQHALSRTRSRRRGCARPERPANAPMLSGSCLCGKVQYEIEGEPRWMYQCHLRQMPRRVRRVVS